MHVPCRFADQLWGAAFGALTCTGPLKVGPDEGVGTASIPRGVQLYVSEGYDGAGASHSIGDARVNFDSKGDNFVGYCRVYVKNLQSDPSTAKVGFISFLWMKSSESTREQTVRRSSSRETPTCLSST